MNDFKVGYEYYELSIKKNCISLEKKRVRHIENGTIKHVDTMLDSKVSWPFWTEFNSKQEAIDALKKVIDEL